MAYLCDVTAHGVPDALASAVVPSPAKCLAHGGRASASKVWSVAFLVGVA